jgi:hypothetical protein
MQHMSSKMDGNLMEGAKKRALKARPDRRGMSQGSVSEISGILPSNPGLVENSTKKYNRKGRCVDSTLVRRTVCLENAMTKSEV